MSLRKDVSYKDGVVYHKEDEYLRCLIPKSLRKRTLAAAHQGHPGRDAMLATMRQKVFWPGMRNDVFDFCSSCRICAFTRPKFVKSPAIPLIVSSPMELVAIDFVGELPVTQRGYRYMLVMVDCFSRFAEVFPVRNMSVETVKECLRQWMSRYGFPDSIISDRGSQFESREFWQYCERFGIQKRRTTAYHPQGNGICERFNGTLWQKLSRKAYALGEKITRWDVLLPTVLFEYRQSSHASTGFSPFELLFSFAVKSQLPSTRVITPKFRRAHSNIARNRQQHLQYYDRNTRSRQFPTYSEAVKKNMHPTKANKFGTKVKIIEQVSDHVVKVQLPDGRIDTVSSALLSPLPPIEDTSDWNDANPVAEGVIPVVPELNNGIQNDEAEAPIIHAEPEAPIIPASPEPVQRPRRNLPEPDYRDAPVLPKLTAADRTKVKRRFPQADGVYGEQS